MALTTQFIDGFDHYATADLTAKYDSVVTSVGTPEIQNTVTRTGASAVRFSKTTGARYLYRVLGMNSRTVTVGFAFQYTTFGDNSVGADRGVLFLRADGNYQLTLNPLNDGRWELRRGSATGTLLGATTTVLPTGSWNFVELRVYVDSTAGEWEIRFNGVTEASGTGVNTQNAGVNYINQFWLGGVYNAESFVDDFHVRGSTTLEAGGFLGDCKVLTRHPQANGAYAQLTPTGAAANWDAVNETTPDGDTTYVASATVGNKDTYDFAALGDPGAIKAVQLNLYSRKEDAGTRLIKPYIKSGATEQAEAEQALSTDYQYKLKAWEQDPNTGAAWTASGLDAAEFGLEVA